MRQAKQSLMIKIMLIILISIGASLTAMGWLNYNSAKAIILDSLQKNASAQVTTNANQLGTWLNTRLKEVEVVANTDTVRSGNRRAIFPYLLNEKERSKGVYSSFNIGDNKGNLVLDNGSVIKIGSEPTFPKVMQGESQISNPFPDKQNPKNLIVTFEAPILDSSKKAVGLISGASPINKVFAESTQFRVGKTDQVYIFQDDGTVIFHPDSDKILKDNIFKTDDKIAKDMIQKQKGSLQYEKAGVNHMVFFSRVPQTDWTMVLDVPEIEFISPLMDLVKWIVISAIITLLLIAILIFIILNGLFKSIRQMAYIAEQVSEGNLGVNELKIKSKDEMGQLAFAINKMVENLRNLLGNLIGQVQESAEHVSQLSQLLKNRASEAKHAYREVVSSMSEMAGKAEIQVHGASESNRAMEEMAVGITRIAESSSDVAESSLISFEQAKKGDETISDIFEQMEHIMQITDRSSKLATSLGEHSEEIGNIVTIITEISNQTNLLSLNAAIEAARAGDQGRGFAVVADEVRKLAVQSRGSAEKIRHLITKMQDDTSQVIHAMDEGYKEVVKGIESVKSAKDLFGQIVRSTDNVNFQIHEISSTSEEMSAATEQVAASVEQLSIISQKTQENSQNLSITTKDQIHSMDELADSAGDLAKMSEELHRLITMFKF